MAESDEVVFISSYSHDPRTFTLHSAAMAGYLDRVRYLVEVEDADVNQKDKHQAIPLFYACLGGHIGPFHTPWTSFCSFERLFLYF